MQLGSSTSVGLVAGQNLATTLPAGAHENVTVKIAYDGPIKAPIKAGQHIADLVVTTADTPPQTQPLVAETDVSEAGFFARIWLGLLSLFGL